VQPRSAMMMPLACSLAVRTVAASKQTASMALFEDQVEQPVEAYVGDASPSAWDADVV
jgi:hypothetical protein